MVEFSGLSVRVSAQVRSFLRGIGRAKESAGDMSLSLRRLSLASDSADRSLSSTGRSAVTTGGMFSAASVSTNGFSFSLTGLTTSAFSAGTALTVLTGIVGGLLATLFPLAAIVGTLTAGLGALAGVFTAIVGTGILAFGAERGEQNKQRLIEVNARIDALEELESETSSLTDAEQEELETLKAIREQEGELTREQETELEQLQDLEQSQYSLTESQQERLSRLEAIQTQTSGLTDAQQDRLETLQQTVEANNGLTESQQEELSTLEETKSELEDQTGVMGGLSSAMADLREELLPIIRDFGERFIPLIEDAINAIPQLVQNIFDAMDGIGRFQLALRRFGQTAFRVIPQITAGMMDLAQRALPVMVDFLQWILTNGGRIFNGMLQTTQDLAPVFMNFIDSFINATPQINELGSNILEVVVPAFASLLDIVNDILSSSAESDNPFQWLINAVTRGLNAVESWLEGGGQERIQSFLTTLLDQIAAAFGGTENREQASQEIVSSLTAIIDGVFSTLLTVLSSDEAGEASAALGAFISEVLSLMVEATIDYVKSEEFRSDMVRLAQAIYQSLLAGLVQVFPGTIMRLLGIDVKPAAEGTQTFNPNQQTFGTTRQTGTGGPDFGEGTMDVEVTVQGDTTVVEDVAVNATRRQLNDQQDRVEMNTGTSSAPR